MLATLFPFACEPFLNALYHLLALVGDSISRACADDVACFFRGVRSLRVVRGVFRAAELAANLVVQPQEYVIIAVGRRCDTSTFQLIRDFLDLTLGGVDREQALPRGRRRTTVAPSPWFTTSRKSADHLLAPLGLILDYQREFFTFQGRPCR